MPRLFTRILFVQAVTSLRVIAAVVFASIALWPNHGNTALAIYVIAISTDALDGFLARRLGVASELGGAYDGFADKAVTVVSVLHVLARGAPVVPCCILLFRDLLVLSIRAIHIVPLPLLPPSRVVGALSGVTVRSLTVYLLVTRTEPGILLIHVWTWVAALITVLLLVSDAWRGRAALREALKTMRGSRWRE